MTGQARSFDQAGETLVGALVLAVAAAFLGFAMLQAGEAGGAGDGRELIARFDRADGIAPGADVRLSGVKVGSVSAVSLDRETYQARVTLVVAEDVPVPIDSVARVATDGLLGGAYVSIEPGGDVEMLPAGGEFEATQGSVDIITLFASLARSGQGQGGQTGAQGPNP